MKRYIAFILFILTMTSVCYADEHEGGGHQGGSGGHSGLYHMNYIHGVTEDYYTTDERFAEFVQNYLEWCEYVDTYGSNHDVVSQENNGFEFDGHIYLTGFSIASNMYYNPSDVSSISVRWDTSNVDFSSGGMESYSIIVQGVLTSTNDDFPTVDTPAFAKFYYNRGQFEYYVTCEGYTCYCPISVSLKFIPTDESSAYTFKAENVKTTSNYSYQISDEQNLVDYERYDEFSNMNFQGISRLTLYNSGLGALLNGSGSFDFVCNRSVTASVPVFPLVYPDSNSDTYEQDLRTYNYITQVLDGAYAESDYTEANELLNPIQDNLYGGMFGLLKYVLDKGKTTFSDCWYNGLYFKMEAFESDFIDIPEFTCDLNFDSMNENLFSLLNAVRYIFSAFFIFKCVMMVFNTFTDGKESEE